MLPDNPGSKYARTGVHTMSILRRGLMRTSIVLITLLSVGVLSPAHAQPAKGTERLRVIIETDAGGDPDDEQSLVRFLLYANEWDVEGIIANRPVTLRPENRS